MYDRARYRRRKARRAGHDAALRMARIVADRASLKHRIDNAPPNALIVVVIHDGETYRHGTAYDPDAEIRNSDVLLALEMGAQGIVDDERSRLVVGGCGDPDCADCNPPEAPA